MANGRKFIGHEWICRQKQDKMENGLTRRGEKRRREEKRGEREEQMKEWMKRMKE